MAAANSAPDHQGAMAAAAESHGTWSELPGELVCLIHQRLIKPKDIIRFRAVCKPWRQTLPRKFKSSVPWLMLPYCSDPAMVAVGSCGRSSGDRCRLFHDVAEQEFHHVDDRLPEGGGLGRMVNCRGSVSGWVFTCDCLQGGSMLLTNPFTGDRIALPPITALPDVLGYRPEKRGLEYLHVNLDSGCKISHGKKFMERNYIMKMALSCPPEEEECIAMVIRMPQCYSHQIAFCKLPRRRASRVHEEEEEEEEEEETEQGWTLIRPMLFPERLCLLDAVFWRGQFYVLDQGGRVSVCDISEPDRPETRLLTNVDEIVSAPDNVYLVVCEEEDELMMVARWGAYEGKNEEEEENNEEEGDGGPVPVDQHNQNDAADDDEADSGFRDLCLDDELRVDPGENINRYVKRTTTFELFRLNEDTKGWDKVESIGEFALFLGFNTAFRVSTRDHPEFSPNSIYFTDDVLENHYRKVVGGFDMGIYSLDTHTVQPLYDISSLHKNPLYIYPSPVWVLPYTS